MKIDRTLQNIQRCPNSTSSTRKLLGRTWVSVRPSGAERYLLSLLLPPLPVSFLSPPPPSPSSPPPCCCSLPRRRGSGSASVSRQRRRTEYGVRGGWDRPPLANSGAGEQGGGLHVRRRRRWRPGAPPPPTHDAHEGGDTERSAAGGRTEEKESLFGGWCACVHYHCEAKLQHRPTDRPPPGIMLKDGRPPPPRPPSGRETNPDRGGGWMTSTREGEWRGGGGEKW